MTFFAFFTNNNLFKLSSLRQLIILLYKTLDTTKLNNQIINILINHDSEVVDILDVKYLSILIAGRKYPNTVGTYGKIK